MAKLLGLMVKRPTKVLRVSVRFALLRELRVLCLLGRPSVSACSAIHAKGSRLPLQQVNAAVTATLELSGLPFVSQCKPLESLTGDFFRQSG